MSTDPAGIPAMIPTSTGYDLFPGDYGLRPRPRAAHRAVMTATTARLNLEAKAGLPTNPGRGAHWAPTYTSAAWTAEYDARIRDHGDVTR